MSFNECADTPLLCTRPAVQLPSTDEESKPTAWPKPREPNHKPQSFAPPDFQ